MQTKTKRLATVAVAFSSLALALGVITFGGKDILFNKSNAEDAGLIVSGSNGAAAAATLKTSTVSATTALGNAIKFDYKNMVVVSGKVGTVKAKGFYGNSEPIYQMTKIVVESNAVPGDAVLKYGKTSACIDGQVDLATGEVAGIDANYFKVVAKNDVTIDTIKATYGCDNTESGFEAMYGETDNRKNYEFVKNSDDSYMFRAKTASAAHYVNKLVVPDYYNGSNGHLPVTKIMNTGNYGLFEKGMEVKEVYFPETINEFGSYIWSGTSHDKVTSITYPRDLAKTSNSGNLVPVSSSLKTINYNCKNLTYTNTSSYAYAVNKDKQPKLETVYVSYDVEKLANDFMQNPAPTLEIKYEGTTAEWNALVASASKWNLANVICSDTTVSKATFHYADSSLNGDASGAYEVEKVSGKTIDNPGTPVWTGAGSKVFDGWYTAAAGGDKVSFPYTLTEDVEFYAHFIDMPTGYSLSDPTAVAVGGTYEMETRADIGEKYYVSYHAIEEQVVVFNAKGNTTTQSHNDKFEVFDEEGTKLDDGAYSNSAANGVKDISLLTYDDPTVVKIHFNAGETRILAWSSYAGSTGYYGKITLNVYDAESTHEDYRYAAPYAVGTVADLENIPENGKYYQTFSVAQDGTYTFNYNVPGTETTFKNCSTEIGYIQDGAWKSLASGTNSKGSKFLELKAGVTYYAASSSYVSEGTYHWSITEGTPDGYAASNAFEITVDGDAVTNTQNTAFNWNYYKFTVNEAGYYVLECSANVYSQDYSFSSTSSSQYVIISANTDMSSPISGYRTFDNTGSSNNKYIYFNLTAGTYYMKASVYSTANTFKVSSVSAADVEGLITATAKAITLTSGEDIDVTGGANGKLFKFTVASDKWHVFTADASATVKIGSSSKSSYVTSFSSTYSMSAGELHKKWTVGNEYYMYVKGTTTVHFELADTIQDGESKDTAYTYVLGTEEKTTSNGGRIKSSTTYFNFAVTETGDYLVNRGTTSTYNFKLFDGTTQLTAASTSGAAQIFSLTAGKTYRIEAYSYGFSITKAQAGYAKTAPIDIEVAADQTSITFNCVFGANGTWYKFTAASTAWYELATTASGVTAEVYIGTNASAACVASASAGYANLKEGDVVYVCVKGTAGATPVFTIAHPSEVHNGLSIETSFIYAYDEGCDYMTTPTVASNYYFFKVEVEPNTDYVIYDNSSVDWDTSAIYKGSNTNSTISFACQKNDRGTNTDTINGESFKIADKIGGTNTNDFYARFNSGTETTMYIKLRLYSASGSAKFFFKTADAFMNGTGSEEEVPCTFDFDAIASSSWYDADYEYQLDANAANRTISFCDGDDYSTVYKTYTYVSENNGVYTFAYNSETITVEFVDSETIRVTGSTFAGTYYGY